MSLAQDSTMKTRFSLRSMLLIALIVGLGAGATAFTIGHDLSGIISSGSNTGVSQQSTTTTSTGSTAISLHQCNQTATG